MSHRFKSLKYHLVKCGLKMVVIRQTLSRILTLLARTTRTMMYGRDLVHALRPDDIPGLDGEDDDDDDDMEILVVEHLGIEKLSIGVKYVVK